MDLAGHEGGEIRMPMSNNFAPINEAPKLKILSGNGNRLAGGGDGPVVEVRQSLEAKLRVKKPFKYRECQKNHAASIGGHATDGCGEFMPSGEEGSLEALKCAACHCHRNFHRREMEGEPSCELCRNANRDRKRLGLSVHPHHSPFLFPPNNLLPGPASHMFMGVGNVVGESDDQEEDGRLQSPTPLLKKRFRTKFTAEQKEKMAAFAEKLGWRLQKHEEAAVQQLCAEIGVERHVLKVWMHNNKPSAEVKQL